MRVEFPCHRAAIKDMVSALAKKNKIQLRYNLLAVRVFCAVDQGMEQEGKRLSGLRYQNKVPEKVPKMPENTGS